MERLRVSCSDRALIRQRSLPARSLNDLIPLEEHKREDSRALVGLIALLGISLAVPACSLLIDTTPDGLAHPQGGQSQLSNAGTGANAGMPSTAVGAAGSTFGIGGASSGAGQGNLGGQTSGTSSSVAGANSAIGGQTLTLTSSAQGGQLPGTTAPSTGGIAAGGSAAGAGGISGGASVGGTTSGGTTLSCPSIPGGPAMVKMPGDYCIDATEVTRAQYTAWLGSLSPDAINNQIPSCTQNLAFEPGPTCMATGNVCALSCDNHPQVCVDWCDAYAYCKAHGKRLCGKIGGGANAFADYADATKSQWYNACSAGGTQIYPYGDTYQSSYCNGAEYAAGTTTTVGFLVKCRAPVPYAGVSDMSGNVNEWEDSCDGDNCLLRGGSFYGTMGTILKEVLACASADSAPPRTALGPGSGFRCCFP